MNFAEQIKDFSSHQASRMIVELLTSISDERLVQLTYLGEKLTFDPPFNVPEIGLTITWIDPVREIFRKFDRLRGGHASHFF